MITLKDPLEELEEEELDELDFPDELEELDFPEELEDVELDELLEFEELELDDELGVGKESDDLLPPQPAINNALVNQRVRVSAFVRKQVDVKFFDVIFISSYHRKGSMLIDCQ